MKKLLCLLLSLVISLSLCVPAYAGEAAPENPTVYVIGAHKNEIYNSKGETIYPLDVDLKAVISEYFAPCLEQLAFGVLIDDFSGYANELNSILAPHFEELALDKDGCVSNGSYTRFHYTTENFPKKSSGFGLWDYRFWYDWRTSPIDTAAELKDCIDMVTSATGKQKVQIIGRCYGANVIAAYLEIYKEHAKQHVSDVSYYSSSAMGIDFMSALFSGDILLEDTAINNFLNYYIDEKNIIEDEATSELVSALLDILYQVKALGLTGREITNFFSLFKDDILPLLIRNSYGGWLSYWSMVTPEKYEQARDYIYNTEELKEEYSGLIAKADDFYYNVQLKLEDTMKELHKEGINFYNFTKYNFPEIPLYEGASAQGDSDTSVFRQSFGATAANYNVVFSQTYLDNVPQENKKYISPDLKIDASTCLFPERTWFIKDLHHDFFSPLHEMSMEIMRYDMTVENEKYPQFLTHIGKGDIIVDELVPSVGPDEDSQKTENNMMYATFRFVIAFIKIFIRILKSNLGLLLG